MQRHIIGAIGDIDDTMIPWEVPHSKAYPAMSRNLSVATGIAEERIIEEIKAVNTRHDTIEYTALIQEMPIFQKLSPQEQQKLIAVAQRSRRWAMEGETDPFPDVQILLYVMTFNGLTQIALSDAPINLAYLRLKKGDIDNYFDLIAGSPSPDDSLFAPEHRMNDKKYNVPVTTIDRKKPNTNLEALLQMDAASIRDRYFLYGNSEHSDQSLARRYGMLFYQTRWDRGTPAMRETLLHYAPERVLAGNVGNQMESHNQNYTHPDFEMVEVQSARDMIRDMYKRGILKDSPPSAA